MPVFGTGSGLQSRGNIMCALAAVLTKIRDILIHALRSRRPTSCPLSEQQK